VPSGTAPGFREYGRTSYEGIARNVGHGGYSWSSTASDTYGVFLDFHVTWLYPSYMNYRAYGFPLRYLSE